MRANSGVEALHEPEHAYLDSERLVHLRFMAPIHVRMLEVSPLHEPAEGGPQMPNEQ